MNDWLEAEENVRNFHLPESYESRDILDFFIMMQLDNLHYLLEINEKIDKQIEGSEVIDFVPIREATQTAESLDKTITIIRVSLWHCHIENNADLQSFYRTLSGVRPNGEFLKLFRSLIPNLEEVGWK